MHLRFGEPSRRRFLLRTGIPVIISAVAIASATAALIVWSSHQADRVAVERQGRLVALVVSQMRDGIAHDQESATVWDDAVRNVTSRNYEWVDLNLGAWMNSYFGHDGAFILDSENKPIFASMEGVVMDALVAYRRVKSTAVPLVHDLRERLRRSDITGVTDRMLSPGVAELSKVDGHPAIISVKPIVSDSGDIEQTPGTEYLHIAVRYLDGSLVSELQTDYLFEDLRFSWRDEHTAKEASYELSSASGDHIGYFIWKPYRPGSAVLAYVAPVLSIVLVVVLAVLTGLMAILRKRSIRLQLSEAKMHHLALHDPLTGLPNRALFNDRLDKALASLRSAKGTLAVLYVDLDRFKQVNDTLGHSVGDDLIKQFAIRLLKLTRELDTVARLGGDEFTIILPNLEQAEDVESLCNHIIESVRRPFEIDGNQIFVGVSVGVALAPDEGSDRIELTRKAGIALYHAKSTGRSRYAIFGSDMEALLQTRRHLEQDLRAALATDQEIEVHYQPLYSATERKITGVEALLRWRHPEHGWISPEVFIPLAEETGIIEKLGEFVLREACKAAAIWSVGTLAVNVSAVQLRNPSFAMKVANTLLSAGMNPRKLELEVTESALTDSSGQWEQNVAALREMGVRIALDDFGTGFSSLSRLQQLKVDRIKIDRSFIHGFGQSGGDEAIVQAIVDLARATGLKTTAEGVETDAQAEYLAQIGCDELQGNFLSRPISKADVDNLLGMNPRTQRVRERSSAA